LSSPSNEGNENKLLKYELNGLVVNGMGYCPFCHDWIELVGQFEGSTIKGTYLRTVIQHARNTQDQTHYDGVQFINLRDEVVGG
jgi:hypothetical protein